MKESQAFDQLRPSTDMVGLEHAFSLAGEEWSPSSGAMSALDKLKFDEDDKGE
jgi:hypothetical protein